VRGFRFGAAATAVLTVVAAAGLFTALTAPPALAHTTVMAGPYALTFGWMNEPCYTGNENAVQLFIHQGSATGAAVGNIQGLTVKVSAAGVTSAPLALNAAFDPDTGLGNPAEYDAPLIPTVVGSYTFTITGMINTTAVNVSATSGDSTFDSAHDPTAIEFPAQPPNVASLAQSVTNLQSALATETAVAGSAMSAANSAKSAASSSKTLGIVAIVIAVLLGAVAILSGRRKAAPPPLPLPAHPSGGAGSPDEAP
jgi:hypothetical protein